MDALHQLEIAWILWIQSLGAWLADPLRTISLLGTEEFFILVPPALYWCLDGALGFRMGIMLLLTNGVNSVFKLAFHSPRPYWFDERIQALSSETSFGLPSGHAQNSAAIWGLLATSLRGKWGRALLVGLIFLIGFSRIYLGMHFVSDVVLGWAIGGVLVWVYLKTEAPILRWIKRLSYRQMLLYSLLTSLLLIAAPLLAALPLSTWQTPTAWTQTALITLPDGSIDPLNLGGTFTIAGTWLGLLAGAAWYYQRTGRLFDTTGTPTQRLLRYGVGLVGILILWYGLGKIFPRNADLLSYLLRYLRYTLVGLWISAAAPLVFQRMGLAESKQKPIPSLSIP